MQRIVQNAKILNMPYLSNKKTKNIPAKLILAKYFCNSSKKRDSSELIFKIYLPPEAVSLLNE
jgi:hypothetical protein